MKIFFSLVILALFLFAGCDDSAKGDTDAPSDTIKVADTLIPNLAEPDSGNEPVVTDTPATETEVAEASEGEISDQRSLETVNQPNSSLFFDKSELLPERFNLLKSYVFGDLYSQDDINERDKSPFFPAANGKQFARMRTKKPVTTKSGNKMYPRHLLKAYAFADKATMRKTIEDWFNSHENSDADAITLGEHVDALKSPPIYGAITNNHQVYMLQTACMYGGDEGDRVKKQFRILKSEESVKYYFEIGCNAGEVVWLKGGE